MPITKTSPMWQPRKKTIIKISVPKYAQKCSQLEYFEKMLRKYMQAQQIKRRFITKEGRVFVQFSHIFFFPSQIGSSIVPTIGKYLNIFFFFFFY